MLLVKDNMTKDPFTVPPGEDVCVAFSRLTDLTVRQAPVVEGGKLLGIVTDRDLRLAVAETVDSPGLTVASVMTPEPVTVSPDTTLKDAARIISRNKFNALPVVGSDGALLGMLTTTDILNGLVKALDGSPK
ncbi:MAG: CBS domain-containing protein [Candidatus Dadabacteria bacterium]|jgi:acetoin utilization protein AcuB|nr:CBS domain-containing protein [Candidatus Dadabacteria bacterium]